MWNESHMVREPLVSCLMVTADRRHLARRALQCLVEQTWKNIELVIVDDGGEDYSPVLAEFEDQISIVYHKIPPDVGVHLGGLRNLTLDLAKGDYCVQWDDDEWYHPRRIELQMEYLRIHDLDATVLRYVLVHMDEGDYAGRVFRFDSIDGTCGTILHSRSDRRYPNQVRSEDLAYLEAFQKDGRVGIMGAEYSHLFVRCYHGTNTWDRNHFEKRLQKSLHNKIDYFVSRYLLGDVFRHRCFRLNPQEERSKVLHLELSRKLDLLNKAARAETLR